MTTSSSKSSEGRPWKVFKSFEDFSTADLARKAQAEKGLETRIRRRSKGVFDLKVRGPLTEASKPNKKKKKSKNKGN